MGRLLVDTAGRAAVEAALGLPFIAGVTTNPTLIRQAGERIDDLVPWLAGLLSQRRPEGPLFAQVESADETSAIASGRRIAAAGGGRTIVKVPLTPGGLRAARQLTLDGIPVCVTAVATTAQAAACGFAGVAWIAIYVGRITRSGGDGVGVVRRALSIIAAHRLRTRVLAASIPDPETLVSVLDAGDCDVTLPPQLLEEMLASPLTAEAIARFYPDPAG